MSFIIAEFYYVDWVSCDVRRLQDSSV